MTLHAYTRHVISEIERMATPTRRIGEADDTYTARSETQAMEAYFTLKAKFLADVELIAENSPLLTEYLKSIKDYLGDGGPSEKSWAEHIERMRA